MDENQLVDALEDAIYAVFQFNGINDPRIINKALDGLYERIDDIRSEYGGTPTQVSETYHG